MEANFPKNNHMVNKNGFLGFCLTQTESYVIFSVSQQRSFDYNNFTFTTTPKAEKFACYITGKW